MQTQGNNQNPDPARKDPSKNDQGHSDPNKTGAGTTTPDGKDPRQDDKKKV